MATIVLVELGLVPVWPTVGGHFETMVNQGLATYAPTLPFVKAKIESSAIQNLVHYVWTRRSSKRTQRLVAHCHAMRCRPTRQSQSPYNFFYLAVAVV